MMTSPQPASKGFSRAFWVSSTVELFERMAYYAVFIVLTIYLSNILGFNDFESSMISGLFSGGLYLLDDCPRIVCYHGRRFVHQVYHIGIGG